MRRASAENLAVVEIYQRDVIGGKTYHCRQQTTDEIQWTTASVDDVQTENYIIKRIHRVNTYLTTSDKDQRSEI